MLADRKARALAGFTLIELMIVVAILGILAVVAIPAFVRYMRIAKTAEAYRMLSMMKRGAVRYYTKSWPNQNGTPQKCQFPVVLGVGTPIENNPNGCCTDGEPDGKCEPNELAWDKTGWRELLFKIADKHYYIYDFKADVWNPGDNQFFAMWARGDLDCDGTYGTFVHAGRGRTSDPNQILNCRVEMQAGIITFNETE